MAIPGYFAQRKMPTGVGAVKMDWPSFHAGREQAAIAEFGRAFGATGELAMKRMNAIAQTEYTTGKADWETAHNLFFEGLRDDPDHKNYVNKYDAYSKKIQKDILSQATMPVAKKILSQMFESKTPSVLESIGNVAWERKRGGLAYEVLLSVRKEEMLGNGAAAEAAIVEAVAMGVLDAKVAAGRVLEIRRNVDWYKGLQLIEADPAGYIEMAEAEGKDVYGPEYRLLPNLDPTQKLNLLNRAKSSLATKRSEQEKIDKKVQAETEQKGWELWRGGKLDHNWIKSEVGNLSKSDRDRYTAILDAEAKLEAKRQTALTDINENTVKRTVVKMIADGIMTEGELDKLAKEYDFTPTEYEGYLRDLKAKQDTLIPYESYAELSDLLDGVRKGVTDESQVKAKIKEFVADATNAGLEKEKATALGVSYREKLSSAIASRDEPALNTPRASMYFDLLSDLYTDEDSELEPLDYDRKYSQMTKYFKDNPDATAEQAAKFYGDLTRDITEDWLDKLLRGWEGSFFGKPYRWLKGEKSEEPKSSQEFEDAVRGMDDEDKAKEYYEKWKDKW